MSDDFVIKTVLEECFAEHGHRVALAMGRQSLTYDQLDEASSLRSQELRQVLRDEYQRKRPRVALRSRNTIQLVVDYFACLRAGVVPFLLDPAVSRDEISILSASCGFDRLIEGGQIIPMGPGETPNTPQLAPSTEVCRFTSGSTGNMKCIEFSGEAVVNAASRWADASSLTREDSILSIASLANGLTFNTSLLSVFLQGGSLWLFAGQPTARRVAQAIALADATRLVAFPAVYNLMAHTDDPLPELRRLDVALSSSAPLEPDRIERLQAVHGLRVMNYYGVAEVGPVTFGFSSRPGGVGSPMAGVAVETDGPSGAEPGELRVKSTRAVHVTVPPSPSPLAWATRSWSSSSRRRPRCPLSSARLGRLRRWE